MTTEISDELADCLHSILLLAHDLKIDLSDALVEKMRKMEQKYPVAKAKALFSCYQGTMAQARIQNDIGLLRDFKNVAREVLGVERAPALAI